MCSSNLLILIVYFVVVVGGIAAFMVLMHVRNKRAKQEAEAQSTGKQGKKAREAQAQQQQQQQQQPVAIAAEVEADDEGVARPRRGMRQTKARRDNDVVAVPVRDDREDGDVDGDDDDDGGDEDTDQKSLKKAKKKAEKSAVKEMEDQQRQDKARKQAAKDEARRKKDEERERIRKEKEEEEARIEAEKKKKAEEEYAKWKDAFSVEEQGSIEQLTEEQSQNLLQEFIAFVKKRKVVILDDLAAEFSMKTQEVVDRIKSLEQAGSITGVIDDRGKFIYIAPEELQSIADFIKFRGRVSISDVVAESNRLIDLSAVTSS